jgi:TPR repeat protein
MSVFEPTQVSSASKSLVIQISRLSVAVGVLLLISTALPIPKTAFAEDKSTTASSLSAAGDATEYVAKAKQAESRLDFGDAIIWYGKAADLGDAESMNKLGWIYFGAHDIPGRRFKDYSKAAIWFQRAANLNYVPAMTQLGVIYSSDGSLGLPADHDKAVELYLKAARAGDAQAMNNLGVMYFQEKGVPRDISEAVYWWKKAVEADKTGNSRRAAQSWLDLLDGKR